LVEIKYLVSRQESHVFEVEQVLHSGKHG